MTAIAYTGQSLASKAVRDQRLQVLELAQLGRRVPRAQEGQVGFIDTMPIVSDLNQLQTAIFDRELDGS
jgi:hypothetical protein